MATALIHLNYGAGLPHHPHTVAAKDRISGDYGKILKSSLGDQHAIEWVFMRTRKLPGELCMRDGNCQRVEAQASGQVLHGSAQVTRHPELTNAHLGGDFLDAGRAKHHAVVCVLDRLSGSFGELKIILYPPDEGMRIQ
jgi:hypothetical protein